MATHAQKMEWWSDYRCDRDNLIALNMNGRYPVRVAQQAVPAFAAMSRKILDVGYRSPMGPTGSYNCRLIGGTATWSLHSFGIAVDWDYAYNPHLRRDNPDPVRRGFGTDPRFTLTEAHIDAVETIVNDDGDRIFKWLGWGPDDGGINDTMHFEIDVPPDRCVPATLPGGHDMPTQQWHQLIDALFTGRPDQFRGDPDYWKTLDADSDEWTDFWAAFVRTIGATP